MPKKPFRTEDLSPPPLSVLSGLFENMCKGLAILENGEIAYCNTAFMQIFKLEARGGIPFSVLQSPIVQHTFSGPLDEFFNSCTRTDFEFQSSLNQSWYAIGICPHPDNEAYKLILCTDISGYRRRDELLSFANKMEALGQLAGGVAHDFNNILSIIEGYARLVLRKLEPDTEQHLHMERIVQASHRGAALTRQLLTFGTHKIIAEGTICLCEFLEEQKTLLKPLLDSRIEFTIECPYDNVFAAISGEQLSQIIINAITNARDAIGNEQGEIKITVQSNEEDILLRISDNGCGMDETVLAKAMEPFFTTKPPGKGTGLGLPQIYGLVQQSGGHMRIESMPSQGTDLFLHLPHGREEDYKPEEHKETFEKMNGQTVLIADDEPDLVHVMRQMLEEYGFNVLSAINGNEALDIQDRYPHKIDWLLSDVVMPDMSGPKLGGLIEAVRPETKIIYMSGYPASGQMSRITLPKEALFLAKPIDPQRLLTIMHNITQAEHGVGDVNGLARLAGAWNLDNQQE